MEPMSRSRIAGPSLLICGRCNWRAWGPLTTCRRNFGRRSKSYELGNHACRVPMGIGRLVQMAQRAVHSDGRRRVARFAWFFCEPRAIRLLLAAGVYVSPESVPGVVVPGDDS